MLLTLVLPLLLCGGLLPSQALLLLVSAMSTRTRAPRAAATAAADKIAIASKADKISTAAAAAAKPAAADKKAAAAKPRAKKAAAVVESSSSEEEEADEEEEEDVSVSESSSSESDEEEEVFVPAKKTAAAAAAKKSSNKKTSAKAAAPAPTPAPAVAAAPSAAAVAPAKKPRAKKVVAAAAAVASVPAAAQGPLTPAAQLHAQLGALMYEAQQSYHAHGSLAVQAQALLVRDPPAFRRSFLAHAAFVCARTGRKLPAIQRVIEWMGTLVAAAFSGGINVGASSKGAAAPATASAASEASVPFAEEVLQQLLQWSGSKDKVVRARSLQLFGEVMSRLGPEAEVAEFLFERATETLLERCRDKVDPVRAAAVVAMKRLQGDGNDDPILLEFLRMMRWDPSKDVRKATLAHVASNGSPDIVAAILARTQDVEPSVRAAAYRSVQTRCQIRLLKIRERVGLIRLGFSDRVPEVSRAARALVTDSWLATKDGDVIRLLKSLSVETFPDECALLLAHCFTSPSVMAHRKPELTAQPPYASQELTPERALYWRVLAETLRAECTALRNKGLRTVEADAALDAALPDTVELCALLRAHQADSFVTAQMLQLALAGVDVSDEAGRRELGVLVETMLRDVVDTAQANVGLLMKVFRLVHDDSASSSSSLSNAAAGAKTAPFNVDSENSFIRVVLELLAEIRDPLEAGGGGGGEGPDPDAEHKRQTLEAAYNALQTSVDKLQVQKQACINTENYAGAEVIKSVSTDKHTQRTHTHSHDRDARTHDAAAHALSLECVLKNSKPLLLACVCA